LSREQAATRPPAAHWRGHPLVQAAVLVALVAGLLAAFLLFSHRSTATAIETASRNEARVLATQMEGALRRVEMSIAYVSEHGRDAIVHDAADTHGREQALTRLSGELRLLARQFPDVIAIFVTDAGGTVRASSLDQDWRWNLADREYFQHARAAPDSPIRFSPALLSRLDDIPTVVGHQPLASADGSFAGMVGVALDLTHFQSRLSEVDAGSQGMVSVRRSDDSRLVMRWPHAPEQINQPAPDIPPFRMIQRGQRAGLVSYSGAADDIERSFAFRALDGYPFFVMVGRAVDEQFALWRQTGYIATAMALATLGLLLAMQSSLRRSQARLQRSEHHFEALIDSRLDANCVWRPDTTVLSCNARYGELIDADAATLPGTRWIDPLPPAQRARALADIEAILGGGSLTTAERRIRRPDGSSRWVRWINLPVLDNEGRCVEVRSIGQDITTQKQTELRLQQLARAVEQSPNTIVITDAAARIEYVNEAFTRTTGYTAEEAMGKNPSILNAGKTPPSTYHELWVTLARGEVWRGEFRNTRKDGSTYVELATVAPVKQPDGRITHYVAIKEDVTDRREAEARIQQLAYYDTLTGLPNRSLMWDRLKQAIRGSERSGGYGMLLLLDIDHFKVLNDTQGHQAGDVLLRAVAQRLQAALHEDDTVARLGDDDFALVLEGLGTDRDEAIAHAERIAERLHRVFVAPYELGLASGPHRCTPSIGITLFQGRASRAMTILKQAEVALNRAKEDGRDAIRFFSEAMQAVVDARAELELRLRAAIEEDGFRLFYQPQVGRDGRVIGAEALIRCFDAQARMISPASFIPLAEETGLIVPIGEWVIDAACAQLHIWQQAAATAALTLSINVSARQFHQPDFVDKVRSALERHRVRPDGLKLELTESVVVGDIEATVLRMQQIKALGVQFALDDFGTGYSSLSYLKRLPFDQIKIDQFFVRDMAQNPSSEAIVRAILAIARSLELEVVAEGVETQAEYELLLTRGCELFQGYLFGKPVPLEAWPAPLAPRPQGCAQAAEQAA
jgi:diguanylate cyclase (GGDEF)-like protein/PAS domain S-box-containing protein